LKTLAVAAAEQERKIESLAKLNATLLSTQETLAGHVERLNADLERLTQAILRALPRHGTGPEAN
jgi:hypothetical protein